MKDMEQIPEDILKKTGQITFIILILIVISSLFLFKEFITEKYYPVRVRFNFIANLKKGADVKFIGGLRIGYIKDIYIKDNNVEILLNINRDFRIREKADISIFTVGMMGEKFIEIDQTEYSGNYVAAQTLLTGNDPLSMEVIQLNLAKLTRDLFYERNIENNPKTFLQIIDIANRNLRQYSCFIKQMRPKTHDKINGYKDGADEYQLKMKNIEEFLQGLNQKLQSVQKQDIINIFGTIKDFNSDLEGIDQSLGSLLLYARDLQQEIKASTQTTNLWGQLIFQRKHYKQIMTSLKEAEDLSSDLADNPNAVFK